MNDSKQNSLSNLPRVHITYDREENGATVSYELPCVIGIISDCSKLSDDFNTREFISITKDNINNILSSFGIEIDLSYSNEDVNVLSKLKISHIQDFHPINILKQIPDLNKLLEIKLQLHDLLTRIMNNNRIHNALSAFVTSGTKDLAFVNVEQIEYISLLFDIAKQNVTFSEDMIKSMETTIAAIDGKFSGFFDYVLHLEEFKKFESTWRGINYLVQNSNDDIKIKLLHATLAEIKSDLNGATDRTSMFHKVYESEYGTLGGSPYSLLLWDYYITSSSEDVQLLRNVSGLAALSHSPSCFGVNANMFDIKSYENLYEVTSLEDVFKSITKAEYNGFRDLEDSRYLSLILPRFLIRAPYGNGFNSVNGINYNENVSQHEDFAWSNSIYAYGQKISESFARYGWFSFVIGVENGGKVSGLPIFYHTKSNGDYIIKCPTEVAITDRRELELSNNGFISLCYAKDMDYGVFFSSQSCQKPLTYDDTVANGSAKLSANFINMLNISRFAQYCKIIIRSKIGTMMDASQIQFFLNRWIAKYVILNSDSSNYLKLKYPLTSASVTVLDKDDPGWYDAIIHIAPHIYLQGISVSLRLVTKLPKNNGGNK